MNGIMISGAFTDQESNGFNYKNNGVYTYHPTAATLNNVGSQQLTDYHYNSSSSIGYISGSWWDRDPANSQGIFVGMGTITDTDNGSQARIEQDYHSLYIIPKYELIGYADDSESQAGIYCVHKTVSVSEVRFGSRHDYHSLMPNPIDEIIGEKWKVASMAGIFTFHKTNFTTFYAVGSLHPTITIGCMSS